MNNNPSSIIFEKTAFGTRSDTNFSSKNDFNQNTISNIDLEQLQPSSLSKDEFTELSSDTVWQDSDDERIYLNLDKNSKLYKLRKFENEPSVKASELHNRLYKFHLKLNSSPSLNNHIINSNKIKSSSAYPSWIDKAQKRKKLQAPKFISKKLSDKDDSDGELSDLDNYELKITGQDKLLSTTSSVLQRFDITSNSKFFNKKVKIKKIKDIHFKNLKNGPINTLEFHDNSTLLLSTSTDKTIRLYHVDESSSHLVDAIKVPNFSITSAKFCPHDKLLLLSNKKSIIEYDIKSGCMSIIPGVSGNFIDKYYTHLTVAPPFLKIFNPSSSSFFAISGHQTGNISLCNSISKRVVRNFKMNAPTTGIQFHPTKQILFSSDRDAYIYEWDIGSGKCIHRHKDISSVQISCLALSRNDNPYYLATGSSSGFLNLHCFSESFPLNTIPTKTFSNLTTPISSIHIHPSNELLAYFSSSKKDALKLIHLPSLSVLSDWPSNKSPFLKRVTSFSFSNFFNYMVIGNDIGQIQLYKIN